MTHRSYTNSLLFFSWLAIAAVAVVSFCPNSPIPDTNGDTCDVKIEFAIVLCAVSLVMGAGLQQCATRKFFELTAKQQQQ